jgi:integrase
MGILPFLHRLRNIFELDYRESYSDREFRLQENPLMLRKIAGKMKTLFMNMRARDSDLSYFHRSHVVAGAQSSGDDARTVKGRETRIADGKTTMLPWLIKWSKVEPASSVEVDAPCFTPEQMAAIVNEGRKQFRSLFAIAAGTGMRSGELFALRVEDVNLNDGVVTVRRSS